MNAATSILGQGTGSPFTVRIAQKSDEDFIFSSWLKSYRALNKGMRRAPQAMYYRDQHRRIEDLISAPGAYVLVCVASAEPDAILGWLAGNDSWKPRLSVAHYAYCKKAFRRTGVLHRLLYAADVASPLAFTHQTSLGDQVAKALRRKGWQADLVTPEELPQ